MASDDQQASERRGERSTGSFRPSLPAVSIWVQHHTFGGIGGGGRCVCREGGGKVCLSVLLICFSFDKWKHAVGRKRDLELQMSACKTWKVFTRGKKKGIISYDCFYNKQTSLASYHIGTFLYHSKHKLTYGQIPSPQFIKSLICFVCLSFVFKFSLKVTE